MSSCKNLPSDTPTVVLIQRHKKGDESLSHSSHSTPPHFTAPPCHCCKVWCSHSLLAILPSHSTPRPLPSTPSLKKRDIMGRSSPALWVLATALSLSALRVHAAPPRSVVDKGSLAATSSADVCSHFFSRQDCGYVGITEDACIQRQCCWSPSMAPIPWCFQRKVRTR